MSRSTSRALVAAALLALIPTAIASAHAELDSASPGPDEVVAGSPSQLVARFTQDLAADRTSIEVRDADGQTVARGGKDPDKARVQRVALPLLEPGTYEVRWVTFSAEDDELARGRYRFSVTAAPATPVPTAVAEPSCPPEPAASSPAAAASPVVPSAPPPAVADPGPSGAPVASAPPSVAPGGSAEPEAPVASLAPTDSPDPCVTTAASAAADASVTEAPTSPEASLAP